MGTSTMYMWARTRAVMIFLNIRLPLLDDSLQIIGSGGRRGFTSSLRGGEHLLFFNYIDK